MSNKPSNLIKSSEEKFFWVWIDSNDFLTNHNANIIKNFTSFDFNLISNDWDDSNLMFIPNPHFINKPISPFQNNILSYYIAEYNLEINRPSLYPSRLSSIFLLESKEEASKYYANNKSHIENRELKQVKTKGEYLFSRHDSSFIEFLREKHSLDSNTISNIALAYWEGENTENCWLKSCGKSWQRESIMEILFYGQVEFM